MLAKLPSPPGAQRTDPLACGCDPKVQRQDDSVLKGCARGRGEASHPRPHPPPAGGSALRLHQPHSLPCGEEPPGAGLCVAHSGEPTKSPKDKLNLVFSHDTHPDGATPRLAHLPQPSCTCRYLNPQARCSNSTQLECCIRANSQARFMIMGAPDLFPLTGIKRSDEYSIWC